MNLVFAHFYTQVPRHLIKNLELTASNFPQSKIYLVTDRNDVRGLPKSIQVVAYKPDSMWREMESRLSHPREFRNNFWFTSIARFLALADFASHRDESFLHIESDVIISPDFPVEKIDKGNWDFAFPVVNDELAIASTLYFRNSRAASQLAQLAISECGANSHATDMHVLKKLMDENPNRVQMLPTATANQNSYNKIPENFLIQTASAIEYFGGVFDGFDIGQYLLGIDPRNRRGRNLLRSVNPDNYLNCRNMKFEMTPSREFPYVNDGGILFPLFSVHVHSKNLKVFQLGSTRRLLQDAVLRSTLPQQLRFKPSVYVKSILRSLQRRFRTKFHNAQ